jgi:hypothetical protein
MLKSQLVMILIYAAFSCTFFAVRRGGEPRAVARRSGATFALMVALSLLAGWFMLWTG